MGIRASSAELDVAGTWVVQTPSPWAMVARRWTCVSSSLDSAAVSASHSCGNCSAAACTGQWCWHSWVPVATGWTVAAYPLRSARRRAPPASAPPAGPSRALTRSASSSARRRANSLERVARRRARRGSRARWSRARRTPPDRRRDRRRSARTAWPGGRDRAALDGDAGVRALMAPVAHMASRWRRIPAGDRPSRWLSSAAVQGRARSAAG